METIFEKQGGQYEIQGDYLLPCFTLGNENECEIGVWANRHRRYLKQNHRVQYYNLLTANKLDNYLADIEKQAEKMYEEIVNLLAEKEKVIEKLK
ncbi:MAG: TnpV protein, partial [Clostridia bacterium]|nr:TnpV protein [Clostridia bacterium]